MMKEKKQMETIFLEYISEYILEILALIVSAFLAWLGLVLKRLYTKHINTQIKKDVVNTVVTAVEQLYKDIHGEEKLNKALEAAAEMLAAEGVPVTELELKMLIEAAVGSFNGAFWANPETPKVEGFAEG